MFWSEIGRWTMAVDRTHGAADGDRASCGAGDREMRSGCALVVAPAEDVRLVPRDEQSGVLLRDARKEDADGLRRMFYGLGDTTRYFYFFTGAPSNDAWAKRVVALGVADGRTSYALVADVEGAVVGVARFVRNSDPRSAEIGILIEDAWQSRGLGTHMLLRLSEEARRRVVTAFTGQILGENRRAIRLARRVFPRARILLSGGVYDVSARLDEVEYQGE